MFYDGPVINCSWQMTGFEVSHKCFSIFESFNFCGIISVESLRVCGAASTCIYR